MRLFTYVTTVVVSFNSKALVWMYSGQISKSCHWGHSVTVCTWEWEDAQGGRKEKKWEEKS